MRGVVALKAATEQRSADLNHIKMLHALHKEAAEEAGALREEVLQLHEVRERESERARERESERESVCV